MDLPLEHDQSKYVAFHDHDGTIALTKINLGARFDMISIIGSQNYEKFSLDDLSVLVAIPASLFGILGGREVKSSYHQAFDKIISFDISSYVMISVRTKPAKAERSRMDRTSY